MTWLKLDTIFVGLLLIYVVNLGDTTGLVSSGFVFEKVVDTGLRQGWVCMDFALRNAFKEQEYRQ